MTIVNVGAAEDDGNGDAFRDAFRKLNAKHAVISRTTDVASISPSDGDLYIVPNTGTTGVFVGQEDNLAWYNADTPGWEFTTSTEGILVYVTDQDVYFSYDGALWNELATGASGGSGNSNVNFTYIGYRASYSSESSTGTGTWIAIPLTYPLSDPYGFKGTGDDILIPAGATKVRFRAHVSPSGHTDNQFRIYKNGSSVDTQDGGFNNEINETAYANGGETMVSGALEVLENDSFEIRYFVASGVDFTGFFEVEVLEGDLLETAIALSPTPLEIVARHWGIVPFGQINSAQAYAEVNIRSSVGGSDLAYTASAGSEFSGSFTAGNANDGNAGTFWSSDERHGYYMDLGASNEANIKEIEITARNDSSSEDQTTYQFFIIYSDDGLNWKYAGIYTDLAGGEFTDGEVRTYDITEVTKTPIIVVEAEDTSGENPEGFDYGPEATYWRVYIEDNNGSSFTALQEIQMRSEIGGADILIGAGGIASLSAAGVGTADDMLGDTDIQVRWQVNQSADIWWQYQFPTPVTVNQVLLRATREPGVNNQFPSDVRIEYSDDGSSWTTAFSVTGLSVTSAYDAALITNTAENAPISRYEPTGLSDQWRLLITGNGGNSRVGASEIELRGSVGGADLATGGTPSIPSGQFIGSAATLFDDDTDNRWLNQFPTAWVQYDFASPVTIEEINVVSTNEPAFAVVCGVSGYIVQFYDSTLSRWITAWTATGISYTTDQEDAINSNPHVGFISGDRPGDLGWPKNESVRIIEDTNLEHALSDFDLAGDVVLKQNNASANTVLMTADVLASQPFTVVQSGTGSTSFVADTGVTLNSLNGDLTIEGQHGAVQVIPDGANTFILIGDLTT